MSVKNTTNVSSKAPVNVSETSNKTYVKKADTEKGAKLKESGPLKELSTTFFKIKTAIRAFKGNLGTETTFKQLYKELTQARKTQLLDRMDVASKDKSDNKSFKNLKAPDLKTLAKNGDFPLPLNDRALRSNLSTGVSVQFGVFIDEAKVAGHKTDTAIRDYVKDKLGDLVKNAGMQEILGYSRSDFLELEQQFKQEGRSLKSGIVSDFLEAMDELLQKETSTSLYDSPAKQSLDEQCNKVLNNPKSVASFMRGKEGKPWAMMLNSLGMNKLSETLRNGIPNLTSQPGFKDLPNTQFTAASFTKDGLATAKLAAEEIIASLRNFTPPQDLLDKLSEFTGLIQEKMGKISPEKPMTAEVVRNLFVDAVILRFVNPSVTQSKETPPEHQTRLMLVTTLLQNAANGVQPEKMSNRETATEFAKMMPGLYNQINEIFVEKFGMPKDAYVPKTVIGDNPVGQDNANLQN